MSGKPPTPPEGWNDDDNPEDGGDGGIAVEENADDIDEVVNADPASSH